MRRAGLWAAGLAASLALHAAAAVAFIATRSLEAPPAQDAPRSRLRLDTLSVPQADAVPQDAQGEEAPAQDAGGASLPAGTVPRSRAAPTPPVATRLSDASRSGEAQAPLVLPAEQLDSAPPTAAPLPSAGLSATPVAASPARPATTRASRPASVALTSQPPPGDPASALPAPGTRIDRSAPEAVTLASTAPDRRPAPSPPLPATRAKAATGWAFTDRIVTDPTALDTIEAFMAPATPEAGRVRDDLTAVLEGVDCARLSATFLPETGTLEMRGHIPDPALRDRVVAALQRQVGEGLPVTANLLHLPAPQCRALTGIADVGLPQSTDQFTDTRLIGQSAHARAYDYTEGQRLQFDLVAPDYEAVIYVDYFTADGEVIHLIPNETVPLDRLAPASLVGVGTDRPDRPGLRLTIGPPYGQEIAVAVAASRPLYEGLRPISEPAGPYLAFLKERVAAARAADPDFKGEWVYFFITTRPAG